MDTPETPDQTPPVPKYPTLRPFVKGSQRAREMGSKGGKLKDPRVTAWRSTIYCTPKCQFYDKCQWVTASRSKEPVARENGRYPRHLCYVKRWPTEVQNTFTNIMGRGEDGLAAEILSTLLQQKMKVLPLEGRGQITLKDLDTFIRTACEVMKTIYGNKQQLEHSGNILIIDDIPYSKNTEAEEQEQEPEQEPEQKLLPTSEQIETNIKNI